MATATAPRRITDSPWFWAYLFGTAALIGLALVGPKYGPRQAAIEREFQGRQRAAQSLNRQTPNVEMSSLERMMITLRPLFLALAGVTMVAWLIFWWTHGSRTASGGRQPP